MPGKIGKIIAKRTGNEDLINILANELPGADLNSLLLEVFARRAHMSSSIIKQSAIEFY